MDVGVPFGDTRRDTIYSTIGWCKPERHSDIHVSEPHYEPALCFCLGAIDNFRNMGDAGLDEIYS